MNIDIKEQEGSGLRLVVQVRDPLPFSFCHFAGGML